MDNNNAIVTVEDIFPANTENKNIINGNAKSMDSKIEASRVLQNQQGIENVRIYTTNSSYS